MVSANHVDLRCRRTRLIQVSTGTSVNSQLLTNSSENAVAPHRFSRGNSQDRQEKLDSRDYTCSWLIPGRCLETQLTM